MAMTDVTGTITSRQVFCRLASKIAAMTTPSIAAPVAIPRNKLMSESRLGSVTTISAPSSGPLRVLRPPMITASRKRIVSSKLYVFGEMYSSE